MLTPNVHKGKRRVYLCVCVHVFSKTENARIRTQNRMDPTMGRITVRIKLNHRMSRDNNRMSFYLFSSHNNQGDTTVMNIKDKHLNTQPYLPCRNRNIRETRKSLNWLHFRRWQNRQQMFHTIHEEDSPCY